MPEFMNVTCMCLCMCYYVIINRERGSAMKSYQEAITEAARNIEAAYNAECVANMDCWAMGVAAGIAIAYGSDYEKVAQDIEAAYEFQA